MGDDAILDGMLSNPFFSDLEPKMVAELAERSEMRGFAPGQYLLREGEAGDAAYVIQAGAAAVSMVVRGQAVEVAEHGAGAFLGEVSLLCEVPHSANVTAKTEVQALRISRDDYWRVMSADTGVLLSVIRILGRRLYETTVPLAYLSFAASALLDDSFDPGLLSDIERRSDEIGRFTGIFEAMAGYVSERTRTLESMVEERTRHLDREIARRRALEAELRQLASTDALTGAHNRRSFFELCDRELQRARRYGRPLALLMLDVDHFKRINDAHGHGVGDEVLKRLVGVCVKNLRPQDIVGRLGGEEFAVAMPESPAEAAERAAERLRRSLSQVEVPADKGSVHFTVSIGVADWPPDRCLEDTLERADKAMYAAKRGGRNRVVLG
jgi:diguanylate cyclase (GGDEF)-like protein